MLLFNWLTSSFESISNCFQTAVHRWWVNFVENKIQALRGHKEHPPSPQHPGNVSPGDGVSFAININHNHAICDQHCCPNCQPDVRLLVINLYFKINIIMFAFLPKMNTENQNVVPKLLPECRFVPSLEFFSLFNFSKQQMEIKVVKCEDTE